MKKKFSEVTYVTKKILAKYYTNVACTVFIKKIQHNKFK